MSTFEATAYGPPWDAMEGSGVTSTGIPLRQGHQKYVVAVDPSVVPYHSKLKIWPNPFGNPNIVFQAEDTGGAIRGNRIDFFVASGRSAQNGWGRRNVRVQIIGKGNAHSIVEAGQGIQAPQAGEPIIKKPGTVTITPGHTTTDTSGALVDSLLAHATHPDKGNLLQDVLGRLSSGAYTHTTDETLSSTPPVIGKAAAAAQAASGATGGGKGGGLVFRGVTFTPGIVGIGKALQKLGLHVGENPHFGGVSSGNHHNYGYYDHFHGGAIDVTGPAWLLNTVANFLAHHKAQLGIPTSGPPDYGGHRGSGVLYQVQDHWDHLHVSARHGG